MGWRAMVSATVRRGGATVFAVALAARLAVVVWAHGRFPPTGDGYFYHRLAERIAAGEGYSWRWPDGTVSAAAHYPVGYPALIAGPYAIFGASPTVAMVVNALLGALGCLAVTRLVALGRRPRAALVAGLFAALHPAGLGYTAALMTEGAVGALLALAAWAAMAGARRQRVVSIVAVGTLIGIATLVRPQSLLLAPAFAFLVPQGLGRRIAAAGFGLAVALTVCAPWMARNCVAMGRCALSVNGGWNLLIGTDPSGEGSWAPLEPPAACRTVWDEAQKDACFGAVAWKRIREAPGAYLSRAPAKIARTFDHGGAPGWYLHAANDRAFGDRAREALDAAELVWARLSILLALALAWAWPRSPRDVVIAALVGLGVIGALGAHGAVAFLAFVGAVAVRPRDISLAAPAIVVALTALVHAAVFGGGRYQLVLFPLLCAPAALGAARLGSALTRILRDRRASGEAPGRDRARAGRRGAEEARS
jgi:4-amino-4-deoxy-L-arabinose transferase-like glycosyltransferase